MALRSHKTDSPPTHSSWDDVGAQVSQVAVARAAQEAQAASSKSQHVLAGLSRKERKALYSKSDASVFRDFTHLMAVKPRQGYVFRSDYFETDEGVGCVLGYFHDESAVDDLPPFWGVGLLPYLSHSQVTTILLQQVSRVTDAQLKEYSTNAERLDALDAREQAENGTRSSRRRASKVSQDTENALAEIQDGATYLNVHIRLLIKAATLRVLEAVIEELRRKYIDFFGNLSVAAYHGLQRSEMTTLFAPNSAKKGKGFYFTSTELSGMFNLVTNGLNDRGGEYVGYMVGDVNNSGVLMDVDMYTHHVVVADDDRSRAPRMRRAQVADMWGSKISQAALINNKRVVHLVLDGADLTGVLGPRMDTITAHVNMSQGDVNMFEVFGERKDQLALFPAHLDKIVLMAEQAYETTDSDRSIIRASLQKTLTRFYVDRDMWVLNAKENVDRLRIVEIPHRDVPRLQLFVAYLEQRREALARATARDDEELHAYSVLSAVFKNLLDANGDLFNTITASSIDDVHSARRVIYDFSSLIMRGKGVAMAQLVNVLAFAASALGEGDTLIIHGTELIDPGVKRYVDEQLGHLYRRGGRVALCYNSIEKMLGDSDFNRFDKADWTALGAMTDAQLPVYQTKLGKDIPVDVAKVITLRGEGHTFVRRGEANIIFRRDLALGVNARSDEGAIAPGRHRSQGLRPTARTGARS